MVVSHYFHYYHYVCPSVLYLAIVLERCSSEKLVLNILMQAFNLQLDHHFVNKAAVETCGRYSASYPKTVPRMSEDLPH